MERAVLFSAVEGRVVQSGQPMAGAVLVREWNFAQDSVRGRDEIVTDGTGRFAFPAVTHQYRQPRFFAQEMIIGQLIRVQTGGSEWRVWEAVKHDIKPGTEAVGRDDPDLPGDNPLQVTIDLDSAVAKRGIVVGHTFFAAAP